MALADELGLDAAWRRAFAEVERMVGGRVVAAKRQARWRPAWFLDVDCGGETRKVYFRGDRGVGQVAFYDPESFRLVVSSDAVDLGPVERATIVHELVQALVDQHTGFTRKHKELLRDERLREEAAEQYEGDEV